MKKRNLSPEELRRLEYEFGEYKDALPEELANALEEIFETIRPHITQELPMCHDLSLVIENLIYKQYPSFSTIISGSWAVRWIREISENIASNFATELSILFDDFANGVSRSELYKDFGKIVAFYTLPHEAHRREMSNFEGEPFWEQEKENILKEWEADYQESIVTCERHNRMKSEFILAVQPVIFKYFGQQTDTFTTEMWQHYGISLGSTYLDYSDNCSDFEYIFEFDELTADPKIGFYEYNQQLKARILGRVDTPTPTNEPENS